MDEIQLGCDYNETKGRIIIQINDETKVSITSIPPLIGEDHDPTAPFESMYISSFEKLMFGERVIKEAVRDFSYLSKIQIKARTKAVIGKEIFARIQKVLKNYIKDGYIPREKAPALLTDISKPFSISTKRKPAKMKTLKSKKKK